MKDLLFQSWQSGAGLTNAFDEELHGEFRMSNGDAIIDVVSVCLEGRHLRVISFTGKHFIRTADITHIITI